MKVPRLTKQELPTKRQSFSFSLFVSLMDDLNFPPNRTTANYKAMKATPEKLQKPINLYEPPTSNLHQRKGMTSPLIRKSDGEGVSATAAARERRDRCLDKNATRGEYGRKVT